MIVHVSWSYRLLVCGIIPISTVSVLVPTIDHYAVRGYITVSFGVALMSPIVVCVYVCKRKMLNIRFLFVIATLRYAVGTA